MKLFQVTDVRVMKRNESPLQLYIQVSGLAASSGWTNPRLDNSADPDPEDGVLVFSFEADRPTGISLPVLTPIAADIEVTPNNGADAVVVVARTNQLVVHASCFMAAQPPEFTTLAVGEEGPPPTTLAIGEETPPTTLAIGEEGPFPSTRAFGEENPPTTLAIGEEGPLPSTRALGEEDPVTTLALGEENPQGPNWGGPFGQFS